MSKQYKVWISVSVEEIDEDANSYRNVRKVGGKLVEDTSPEEIPVYEANTYDRAQIMARLVTDWLVAQNERVKLEGGADG
jgi:predicted transport protein